MSANRHPENLAPMILEALGWLLGGVDGELSRAALVFERIRIGKH